MGLISATVVLFVGVDKIGILCPNGRTRIPKVMEFFFMAIFYNFIAFSITGITMLSILRPNSPEFVSSIILPHVEDPMGKVAVRILSSVFTCYYALTYCGNGCLWIYCGFAYGFSVLTLLHEIKWDFPSLHELIDWIFNCTKLFTWTWW